ncbi:MAG: YdeI/OmpD-associated family protein [Pseudomonadota bacterium]
MAVRKAALLTVSFSSQRAWEKWLAAQSADALGVWLKLPKKAAPEPSVTKAEAIESALTHGWIDGQIGAFDAHWFVTRFTPRRAQSRWSKINCATAERLIGEGRMQPAGLAEVERAKADGRWDAAYAGQASAAVPKDLKAALDASPKAKAFFKTLNSVNRYAILYRVGDAKKPETRAARIAKFIAMLERGERIHEK